MTTENPSILSHMSIGTNRFDEAVAFYDQVLATLGCKRILAHPGAIAWGREYPEFWVQKPINGAPATVGNGSHVGFIAQTREAVEAFYKAALAAGGQIDGAPGPRLDYGAPYYGCFVRDLDGHKIEASYWDDSLDHAAHDH